MATFKSLKSKDVVMFCHSTLAQITFVNGVYNTDCPNQIKQLNENPACEAVGASKPPKKKEGGE